MLFQHPPLYNKTVSWYIVRRFYFPNIKVIIYNYLSIRTIFQQIPWHGNFQEIWCLSDDIPSFGSWHRNALPFSERSKSPWRFSSLILRRVYGISRFAHSGPWRVSAPFYRIKAKCGSRSKACRSKRSNALHAVSYPLFSARRFPIVWLLPA